MSQLRILLLAAAAAACVASQARADGPSRPATQVEKDYSLRVLTVLSRALPPPLPGFQAVDGTKLSPFEYVSLYCESEPLRVVYSVTWVNRQLAAEERRRKDAAIARAVAKMKDPALEQKEKEITARRKPLEAELKRAVEQKDSQKMTKVMKQMDELGKELAALGDARRAVLDEELKSLPPESSGLRILLNANGYYGELPATEQTKPISGHPAFVHRSADKNHPDRITVLVGPSKSRTELGKVLYSPAADQSLPHTRVQTVAVAVDGDPDHSRKLLEGMDWRSLTALIAGK